MVVQDGHGASAKDKQLKVARRLPQPPIPPGYYDKPAVAARHRKYAANKVKARLRTKYGHTRLTGGAAGNL